jgi:hypothetical protein
MITTPSLAKDAAGEDDANFRFLRSLKMVRKPEADRPVGKDFTSRTYLHTDNTLNCPAVYYIVKKMRQLLRR